MNKCSFGCYPSLVDVRYVSKSSSSAIESACISHVGGTADGPTVKPTAGASTPAESVVLTSGNLDEYLGKTATVTSLRGDVHGVKASMVALKTSQESGFGRMEALLTNMPPPGNRASKLRPAAPRAGGGSANVESLVWPAALQMLPLVVPPCHLLIKTSQMSLWPCIRTSSNPSKSI